MQNDYQRIAVSILMVSIWLKWNKIAVAFIAAFSFFHIIQIHRE